MNNYPNGYWPKIQYWNERLAHAIASKSIARVNVALARIDYFTQKQFDSELIIKCNS